MKSRKKLAPSTIRRRAYTVAKETREKAAQLLEQAQNALREAEEAKSKSEHALAEALRQEQESEQMLKETFEIEMKRRRAFSINVPISDLVSGNESMGFWLTNLGTGICEIRQGRAAIVKHGNITTHIEFGKPMEAFLLELAKASSKDPNVSVEISCCQIS